MKKSLALSFLMLVTACETSNSYSRYPSEPPHDCRYYGTCGHEYQYDDRYRRPPAYYDHDRYDDHRSPDWSYQHKPDWDRDHDRDRDRDHDHDRKPDNDNRPQPQTPAPAPAQKPAAQVIRPNCPSGTQYTGRTCKIVDQKLRRPGGDGNINPCPSGMWVSGDKCVGK